jgi:carboxypeptidase family protein
MKRCSISALLTILLAVGSSGLLFGQRADRGLVTGVIQDPSGKTVLGATVKVKNDDTGVVTDLTTNDAGSYSSPSLVLGKYTITVEMVGFKSAVRSGIRRSISAARYHFGTRRSVGANHRISLGRNP